MRNERTRSRLYLIVAGLASLGLLSGCQWLEARDNLNKGVNAYSASNYSLAAEHFQTALELDPDIPNAELYLAMAYARQHIPNFATPENERLAEQAVATYESVLEKDPTNGTAIGGLASIYQNQDRLEEAREWYLRHAEVDPDNPDAHYSAGSINWHIIGNEAPELVYGPEDKLPMTPEEEAMSEEEYAAHVEAQQQRWRSLMEEGQQALDRALELDPDYEDAMTFKNLLYRMEAGLISEDTEDEELLARRAELLALADEWLNKANETRQRLLEEQQNAL